MQSSNNNPGQAQAQLNQALLKEKEDHFLSLCYAVFKLNPQGAELLAMLKESLIDLTPVADPKLDEKHAYFREGQNHVIRSIIVNIKLCEDRARQNNKKV